ncbi:phosphatase PAP2 family protein [Desulfovibrio sp. QI0430]
MILLNHQIFLAINASDAASPFAVWAGGALAEWPIGIAVLLTLLAVVRQKPRGFAVALALRVVLTVAVAMGSACLIRMFHYNPRPFVLGIGRMLIAHEPTSSLPSLHATFLFSMAFALLLHKGPRGIALVVMLLGFATAWARIFVGVHYPLDMAGAFLTACLAAVAVKLCFHQARSGL